MPATKLKERAAPPEGSRAAASTDSRTIRVRPAAYAWLTEEARARGESMPEAVDHLIRDLERWKFAVAAQAGYARLRGDDEAWADFRREVAELDGTVADGLDAFPWEGA